MVQSCMECNAFISPRSPALKCLECKKWIHAVCTGLQAERVDFLLDEANRNGGERWTCDGCSRFLNVRSGSTRMSSHTLPHSVDSLEATIASVLQKQFELKFNDFRSDIITFFTAEINKVKSDMEVVSRENKALRAEINELRSRQTHSTQELVQELREQDIRSKNVIVFGIPESKHTRDDLRRADDTSIVENTFRSSNINAAPLSVIRLGKINKDKVRPLKLTFADSATAKSVLKCSSLLKDNIRFKSDLTPSQQSHLKHLNSELKRRNDNGENLTIKYIRSVPKIVSKSENK